MITTVTNDRCFRFRGLSTDEKPTDNVGNGSTFFEIDTSDIYIFNEESSSWVQVTLSSAISVIV